MNLGFIRSVGIFDAIWYLRRVCVVEIVLLNAVQLKGNPQKHPSKNTYGKLCLSIST